jgi:Na+-driven multidrug efflux pump
MPVAFGAIFALSGSIGPILGQNFGARRFDRVRRAIIDSMVSMLCYCAAMWLALIILREPIVRLFGASGEGAELIRFFCVYIAGSMLFIGALFVANATFNNLGFPTWSTVLNWGRATIGTIPFAWIGATYFGAAGVLAGQALGAVLFGIGAVIVCLSTVGRLAAEHPHEPVKAMPDVAPPIPPFSSDKAATAIDWTDLEDRADAPRGVKP